MVLRYGGFYGPGTGLVPGGDQWEMVRARKFPLVGDGGGMWSLCHIAGRRVGHAWPRSSTRCPAACLNICDDEPAPAREFLPYLADAVGAKPPRHIPRWVARLMGAHLVLMMCTARGASNARAKRVLGWEPSVKTWRDGFRSAQHGVVERLDLRRASARARSAARRRLPPRRPGARGRRRRSRAPARPGRWASTSSPVSPSRRISGRPPWSLATTQQPAAAASSAALGSGSGCLLGTAITSAAP